MLLKFALTFKHRVGITIAHAAAFGAYKSASNTANNDDASVTTLDLYDRDASRCIVASRCRGLDEERVPRSSWLALQA
ncbi:hypothetical protein CGZ80_04895 [Rhodopirellula sp. MGV]|nr:hypothetical protein CGZ80_04895 [Rhodopirellula sp. MGV]